MKKKNIVLLSILTITTISTVVAFSTIIVTGLTHKTPIENKLYKVNFIDENNSVNNKTYSDLELDSGFDLIELYDENKTFTGWKLDNDINKLYTKTTTIKTLMDAGANINNNTISLYASWDNNVPPDDVWFSVTDNTLSGSTYLMKVKATNKFSLFNFKYGVNDTIVKIQIGNMTYNDINQVIDISGYNGQRISVRIFK